MKVVARIEKVAGGKYRLDGEMFDSFISARREMIKKAKELRCGRESRNPEQIPRLQAAGA